MDAIDQSEKTIVFCATQDHALAVRDLINQMKKSAEPNYCVRVTAHDGELGEQHLRQIQDNEKTIPTILTTSQKLATGVDARNVRNIVLMRPINSMPRASSRCSTYQGSWLTRYCTPRGPYHGAAADYQGSNDWLSEAAPAFTWSDHSWKR